MKEKTRKCSNGHRINKSRRRFITDEKRTFFDEVCDKCILENYEINFINPLDKCELCKKEMENFHHYLLDDIKICFECYDKEKENA